MEVLIKIDMYYNNLPARPVFFVARQRRRWNARNYFVDFYIQRCIRQFDHLR